MNAEHTAIGEKLVEAHHKLDVLKHKLEDAKDKHEAHKIAVQTKEDVGDELVEAAAHVEPKPTIQ